MKTSILYLFLFVGSLMGSTVLYAQPFTLKQLNEKTVGVGTDDPKAFLNVLMKRTVLFGVDSTGGIGRPTVKYIDKRGAGPDGTVDFNYSNSSLRFQAQPLEPKMIWYGNKGAFRAGGVYTGTGAVVPISGYRTPIKYLGTSSIQQFFTIDKVKDDFGRLIAYDSLSLYRFWDNREVSHPKPASTRDIIGDFSFASGANTRASGQFSTAMGYQTQALGHFSTALGYKSWALGDLSFVIGNYSLAGLPLVNSEHNVTALDDTPGGNFAICIGSGSIASATNSIVLGNYSYASSKYSVAIGFGSSTLSQQSQQSAYGGSSGRLSPNGPVVDTPVDDDAALFATAMGYRATAQNWYAMSLGQESQAIGEASMSMGFQTKSIGNYSLALGQQSVASGDGSMTVGFLTTSSGRQAISLGTSTTATGDNSAVLGYASQAIGLRSLALGSNVQARGESATAIGKESITEGNFAVAIGNKAKASGNNAVALGNMSTASGESATAFGYQTSASQVYATAMGQQTQATGQASTALGQQTSATAVASTAMGLQSQAHGNISTAMGRNTIAGGNQSVAMGFFTRSPGENSVAMGELSQAAGRNAVSMGFNSQAQGRFSLATGANTTATGDATVSMGQSTTASGAFAMAQGIGSVGRGSGSVAMGFSSVAGGDGAVSMGQSTTASGPNSTATGSRTWAVGNSAVTMGSQTTATGENSIATGSRTLTKGVNSVAMGDQSVANGDNAIALGTGAIAFGRNAVAIGSKINTDGQEGSMIFGDALGPEYTTTQAHQMVSRFAGGIYMYASSQSQANATGVFLRPNGNAWTTLSDSTTKEKFQPADGAAFLQKISRMRLGSWNYKGQDARIYRHYGPMAQDFFAAFGRDAVGTIGEEKSINQADFDGVNLIAIKALIEEVNQLKAELAAARDKEQTTQARLDKIEALLSDRASTGVISRKP